MDLKSDKFIKARVLTRALKTRYWPAFRSDRNITGMAFGSRSAHGERTDEPAVVIYVVRKIPERFIPPSRLLPRRMYLGGDKVEVDIVETGPLYPLAFTGRTRPADLGISIGNLNDTSAGTFGAVMVDNTDGANVILSNNHVLARVNAGVAGEVVVQPGVFDGGGAGDRIGALKRFVMLNATGNIVDGAIASIDGALGGNVTDQVHNNVIATASHDHPAVGLLFAGGCARTLINPINDVLAQLNISFPGGAGATASVDVGSNVEKVGRTTEYTTSTVTEIDVTAQIDYNPDPNVDDLREFDNQIATAWMSDPGDSGSLVYLGGNGGEENHCGCGGSQAASSILDTDVGADAAMVRVVRDKYLRPTALGRWAIDMYYRNEAIGLQRLRDIGVTEEDRAYAKKLFDKYGDTARQAFVHGTRSDERVTEAHLREAKQGLKRAARYLNKDEMDAAHQLLELASEVALGKNAREILAVMNDEKLVARVREIVGRASLLKHDDC